MSIVPISKNRAHLDSLIQYIKVGVEEGANLVHGGKRLDRPGITDECICKVVVSISVNCTV